MNPGQFPRNSYDECVNYITSQCDSSPNYLRETVAGNLQGHATTGTALALKARTFLYAASELLGMPVHGVDIERVVNGEDVSYSYTVKEVEERKFEEKMYLYPIPSAETLNNTGITQNPGW